MKQHEIVKDAKKTNYTSSHKNYKSTPQVNMQKIYLYVPHYTSNYVYILNILQGIQIPRNSILLRDFADSQYNTYSIYSVLIIPSYLVAFL